MESTPMTAFLYTAGALVTALVLVAGHHPKEWTVDLVPENTVQPGDNVEVPMNVLDDYHCNVRLLRVVRKLGPNRCLAIDIEDTRNHNSMCVAFAVGWPVLIPVMLVASMLGLVFKRRTTGMVARVSPRNHHPAALPDFDAMIQADKRVASFHQ